MKQKVGSRREEGFTSYLENLLFGGMYAII